MKLGTKVSWEIRSSLSSQDGKRIEGVTLSCPRADGTVRVGYRHPASGGLSVGSMFVERVREEGRADELFAEFKRLGYSS
jgi:hypothetical protein